VLDLQEGVLEEFAERAQGKERWWGHGFNVFTPQTDVSTEKRLAQKRAWWARNAAALNAKRALERSNLLQSDLADAESNARTEEQ
jgi:hypothetical protein